MSSARDVSGNGAATTVRPAAFSGPITLLQLDPSAQAPCTSTTSTWLAGMFSPFESDGTRRRRASGALWRAGADLLDHPGVAVGGGGVGGAGVGAALGVGGGLRGALPVLRLG